MTIAFAMLRLLPMSDRDKEVEILALRHQIMVLERQLGGTRPRFGESDRAFLAGLLHQLPRDMLRRVRLLVRSDTVLRWHRDLVIQERGPPKFDSAGPRMCLQIQLQPSPIAGTRSQLSKTVLQTILESWRVCANQFAFTQPRP